jgi:hypothetical protein
LISLLFKPNGETTFCVSANLMFWQIVTCAFVLADVEFRIGVLIV